MHAVTTFALLAAAATLVSAGNVYVDNYCGQSIWLESFANTDAPGFQTQIFRNVIDGYTEIQRAPTEPAGNNSILVDTDPSMSSALIFSYSINNDAGVVFYSLVSNVDSSFEALGYEVLTDGGHAPLSCPAQGTFGQVCVNARNTTNSPEPVFTVPITGGPPGGPNFTFRLCRFGDP